METSQNQNKHQIRDG